MESLPLKQYSVLPAFFSWRHFHAFSKKKARLTGAVEHEYPRFGWRFKGLFHILQHLDTMCDGVVGRVLGGQRLSKTGVDHWTPSFIVSNLTLFNACNTTKSIDRMQCWLTKGIQFKNGNWLAAFIIPRTLELRGYWQTCRPKHNWMVISNWIRVLLLHCTCRVLMNHSDSASFWT